MNIKSSYFNTVIYKINEIKNKNSLSLSNIFDFKEFEDIITNKKCISFETEYALFVLTPFHEKYYNIFYMASDIKQLENILNIFIAEYKSSMMVRVSVIGKEPQAGDVAKLFERAGFLLGKRLARMIFKQKEQNIDSIVSDISSEKISYGKQKGSDQKSNEIRIFQFAVSGDEYEIFEMLQNEFDICDDNIPEVDDIAENVKKKQVVVIRDNGKIVSFHYFELKNNKYYGLYDVTRPEYRSQFLVLGIYYFLNNYFSKNKIVINRSYGWRDTANKRLMKFALLNNQIPDGVYIYNMKFKVVN